MAHQRDANQNQTVDPIAIDLLDEDDYATDDTLEDEDMHDADIPNPSVNQALNRDQNPFTSAAFAVLQSLRSPMGTIKPGKSVELRDQDFLRVTLIVEHRISKEVLLLGTRLRRNKNFNGKLELKANEVSIISNERTSHTSSSQREDKELVRLVEVVKMRSIIFTNQAYPALRYSEIDIHWHHMTQEWNAANARLVCRWHVKDLGQHAGLIRRLRAQESDEGYRAYDDVLRTNFRGVTIKGGSALRKTLSEERYDDEERRRVGYRDPLGFHTSGLEAADMIDLTLDSVRARRYTIFDAFCGAGGASRGAKAAGLQVEGGLDSSVPAIVSYSLNFPDARCWAARAHDFITTLTEDIIVELLHMSPPCQPLSPAHTRPGQHDEMNQASFLAMEGLIERTKPRIVTMEETFGLTRTQDNLQWLHGALQVFTRLGFSVRHDIFDLRNFGSPSPRIRFFLYASCPGEPLPDFPEPTHCNPEERHLYPNREPWMSINQTIRGIPHHASHHDLQKVRRFNRPPYDGDQPARNTICCSSGQSYHPSGERAYTNREIASLNGIPEEHSFGHREVRKQIGNAFPAIAAKVFFLQAIRSMSKADGL